MPSHTHREGATPEAQPSPASGPGAAARVRKPALELPRALVFTTFGCAVAAAVGACSSSSAEAPRDAAADVAPKDAAPDGCIYQLCDGPTDGAACPGVVCLQPTESCPPGCGPFI